MFFMLRNDGRVRILPSSPAQYWEHRQVLPHLALHLSARNVNQDLMLTEQPLHQLKLFLIDHPTGKVVVIVAPLVSGPLGTGR